MVKPFNLCVSAHFGTSVLIFAAKLLYRFWPVGGIRISEISDRVTEINKEHITV